jgi:serine/threonine-protein kinase
MTAPPLALTTALADRYRIERELGAGGMATVYLAEDIKHRRKVALKVLRPELAAVLGAERFLKEIQVTANLQHPHILGLFDSGSADGFLYYVMPYVEGESLRQHLKREHAMAIPEALHIATQVASALDYAHRQGVIHRDIKPENILIHEGEAMLADFGIALAVQEAGGDRLTQTGLSLGTPQYMSPEQATGDRDADGRSDMYSLAAVTYEMLAGEPPVTGPTARAIIAKLLMERPSSLRVFRDSVTPELDAVVLRALSTMPTDRFATAKEFGSALSATVTVAPTAPQPVVAPVTPPAPSASKASRLPTALIGGVIAAVAAATAIVALWPKHDSWSAAPTATSIQSVAVLPFAERATDSSAFLGDGIAETLIYALGKVPSLKVAAQTSSFAFKGKETDLQEIGDKLGVATVLAGSLQRAGDRLRVIVRLENIADHRELWTERYDSDVKDVFALQDSIARAVVSQLQAGKAQGAIVRAGTANVAAYEAYLQGRVLWGQRGDGIKKGLAFFERAVALDSSYALAWTGVADCYALLNMYGELPTAQAYPKAKFAIARALALDSTLAAAHATNGFLIHTHDYDVAGAEREFRRAIELDSTYVVAHYWYGNTLAASAARLDQAIAENRRAVALDPLSGHAANLLSQVLIRAGKREESIAEAKRAVSLTPSWTNYRILGAAYAAADQPHEALAAVDTAFVLSRGQSWVWVPRARLRWVLGDTAAARRDYDGLVAAARAGRAQALQVAAVAAWVRGPDEALSWLDRAIAERDPNVGFPHLIFWPARLAADPRFVAKWKAIGLESPTPGPFVK